MFRGEIMKLSTKRLAFIALMAAVTGVLSQIVIPLPFTLVPINMATFGVFVAGSVLGAKDGTISLMVYVLVGLIGIPVFSGFGAGPGVIVGPTGGYIIGYIAAAFAIGIIAGKSKSYTTNIVAMVVGLFLCYALGTIWYIIVTKTDVVKAIMLCVVPFLIGDAIKITAASIVSIRVKKAMKNQLN